MNNNIYDYDNGFFYTNKKNLITFRIKLYSYFGKESNGRFFKIRKPSTTSKSPNHQPTTKNSKSLANMFYKISDTMINHCFSLCHM